VYCAFNHGQIPDLHYSRHHLTRSLRLCVYLFPCIQNHDSLHFRLPEGTFIPVLQLHKPIASSSSMCVHPVLAFKSAGTTHSVLGHSRLAACVSFPVLRLKHCLHYFHRLPGCASVLFPRIQIHFLLHFDSTHTGRSCVYPLSRP